MTSLNTNALSRGSPTASVSQLVQQAQSLLDKLQPEHAIKFLERAHSISPANVSVIDLLGEVSMQLRDMKNAHQYFALSIKVRIFSVLSFCKIVRINCPL